MGKLKISNAFSPIIKKIHKSLYIFSLKVIFLLSWRIKWNGMKFCFFCCVMLNHLTLRVQFWRKNNADRDY